MSEIETLWISLAVSGKNLKRDMDREVTGAGTQAGNKIAKELEDAAGKGAKRAAQQIDRNLGRSLGERTGAALGTALGVGLRPVVGTVQRLGGEAGRQWVQKFSQQLDNAKVNAPKVNAPINVDLPSGSSLAAARLLSTGARVAGAGAAAGLTAVLAKGFDRLKVIDSARFKLTALGNDAAAVNAIMDSALKSVQGTAFSLGDAASAAAAAVAAGVKPGEELTKYLTSVGDSAAVAGASFSDMASIFNKVRANGVAYTDDLQQLQDRGLPVMQLLQEKYGVTAQVFRKMVEDGKVSAADFEQVMTQKMGGAAQKMGQSFEGGMQNLGAAVARVGANLLSSVFGGAPGQELAGPTEAVQRLTEQFNKVDAWVVDHGPQIHQFFAEAGEDVRVVGDGLGKVLGFLGEHPRAIEGVAVAFAGWKAITAISAVVEGLTTATALLKGIPALLGAAEAASAGAVAASGGAAAASRLTPLGTLGPAGVALGIPLAAGTFMAQAGGPTAEEAATTKAGNQNFDERLARSPFKTGAQIPKVGTPEWNEMRELASTGRIPGITVRNGQISDAGGNPVPELNPRMFGAIAMAFGGLRQISKPQSADIYAGRGAGTIFAEEETGGEAYIPLAPGKRPRSMAILREVMRIFGVNSFADGGLNAGASYIKGLIQQQWPQITNIGGYRPPDGFNEHSSGNALDIMIPGWNTAEGQALGDQVGGWIAANAESLGLTHFIWRQRIYKAGDTAGTPMEDRGSPTQNHMDHVHAWFQKGGGALPSGPIMAAAAGGSGGGGGGAAASQVMSAQGSVRRTQAATAAAQKDLDDANAELNSAPDEKKRAAAEKKRDNAQRRLDSAKDRQAVAEQKLSEVLDKKAQGTDKEAGSAVDGMGQGLGQGIISGLFQGLGIDGSVISNPMEWPNMKSGLAALNWGLNYAQKWAGADSTGLPGGGNELNFGTEVAGGAMSGLGVNIPNVAPTATQAPPRGGDTYNISGVDPREMMQKIDARQMPAARRQGFS